MQLKLVHSSKTEYPRVEETVRPFRIWDSKERRNVPHRYYSTQRRAQDSALLIIRWEKVGRTLEVYDARTSRWLGTYIRRFESIVFTKD